MKTKSRERSVINRIESLVRDQLEVCVSCGTCRKACTVFPDIRKEAGTPRGKLQLINAYLEGHIKSTPSLHHSLEQCTLCGLCSEICPNHVDPEGIFTIARSLIVKPSLIEKIFSFFLTTRTGLILLAMVGNLTGSLLPRQNEWLKVPEVIPLIGGRIIPKLKPNLRRRELHIKGEDTDGERIVFYPGCFIDFALQNQLRDAIKVLLKGASEIIIPSLPCCGLPSLEMGIIGHAYTQAEKIVAGISNYSPDKIVVICGSCGSTFKKVYPFMDEKFKKFSENVYDITEVLYEWIKNGKYPVKKRGRNIKVSLHHCCHLKRGMDVDWQVEKLLYAHPDIEYLPLERPDTCCGFGGIMYVKHRELSDSIVKDKVKDITSRQPDYLVTGCPGCLIHIQGALLKNDTHIKCLHPVQLFA